MSVPLAAAHKVSSEGRVGRDIDSEGCGAVETVHDAGHLECSEKGVEVTLGDGNLQYFTARLRVSHHLSRRRRFNRVAGGGVVVVTAACGNECRKYEASDGTAGS